MFLGSFFKTLAVNSVSDFFGVFFFFVGNEVDCMVDELSRLSAAIKRYHRMQSYSSFVEMQRLDFILGLR